MKEYIAIEVLRTMRAKRNDIFMDGKTESKLTKILYFSMGVILVFMVFQNIESPWMGIFLSGLLGLSVTVRNVYIYSYRQYYHWGKFLFLMDVFIVFLITRFDSSGSSKIFYLVLIGDASIAYNYFFSGGITLLCFLSHAVEKYMETGSPSMPGFVRATIFDSLAFIATLAIMNIVKYEIIQREKLSKAMFELKFKTKQLESAYSKLKETSEGLEEITILKERNRIAREIHDTVGHTLTTVLIELEAGERLLKRDLALATEKIILAKNQVRKGLAGLRESVGMLNEGKEIVEFVSSIRLLIDETTKHGEVFIKHEISGLPALSLQQEKALYRALQEGLTNGIKHGKSTAFVFKLKYENGVVIFFLQDNGTGCEKIIRGFGLTAMEQRIREVGGILNIESGYQEGCCIQISIPVSTEGDDNGCHNHYRG